MRDQIYIASKTMGRTPEAFREQLNTSLKLLKTDYLDIYQFHCVDQCYRPGDGTGMYECMLEAKAQGKTATSASPPISWVWPGECIESELYETLQYPLSYISSEKELELVKLCKEHNMGFIAMKGLAGGLIRNSRAAFAFMSQFDNVLPIWGVQKMTELEEWLSYMDEPPALDAEITAFIEKEKAELSGEFCRGCATAPCPAGILINSAPACPWWYAALPPPPG